MAYDPTELELRRLPEPQKPGRRMPKTAEAVLGAALLISFIACLAYTFLAATAVALERQIDQAGAARGTVEAP